MVLTSVAVATPSTTAPRITNGSSSAGIATTKVRHTSRPGARSTPDRSSRPAARRAIRPSTQARNKPGSSPAVNSPAIDTDVTDPITISTMEGGIVSLMAPEAASNATSSPSSAPRRFISGNSTGATAAMSAALDPLMPDTSRIAPISTKEQPTAHVAHQRGQERPPAPAPARSSPSTGPAARTAAPPAG